MFFIGLMLVCSVNLPPGESTCSVIEIGTFTDRQLCFETADVVRATLPPDMRPVMLDCGPAEYVPYRIREERI